MGAMHVPAGVYYGAQTARALANFRLTGRPVHPELIRGLAAVKWAAARANGRLGLLSEERCRAIEAAAREVFDGRLHEQFV
ncbi:MAG: aspartate ammonia-lyase, partial [Candidatus Eisenbacteria bacterium]|nr:aspartate ammonia-lyase [Candidatus Latescibacterota bacterium]MBD3301860.1 aspartate ammonia-lyase [Candidatus Eisenbacteria bacterium]